MKIAAYILALVAFVAFAGCAAHSIGITTSNFLGSAKAHVTSAIPHADKEGQQHLHAAVADIDHADAQVRTDAQAFQTLNDKYVALDNSLSVRVGKFLAHTWHIILAAFGIGLVLRIASQIFVGRAGTVMSLISTGIFGVLSGGVSLIQATFDNLWFRRNAPTNSHGPN